MRALVVCNGGGIGDAFVATPVMRALRMRYDHITALTTMSQAPVISSAAADEVWLDTDSFFDLIARLRAGRFDAVVITWATARIAFAVAIAGIAERVGQSGRLYSPLFTKRVTLASEHGDHTTRWVQMLLNYARALQCDGDATPITIVDDAARSEAGELMNDIGVSEHKYIILHPSRGIAQMRHGWPASAFARIGQAMREHYEMPVLISGSEAERESAEAIARRAGGVSIAGRVSLRGFAALSERSALVVAMDSGPMHLAAATGTPTVGIFAMRPDEPDRWHPVGRRTAVVRCAYPCPASHTKERCPDFACVRELDAARVLAVADGLLALELER